MSSPARLYRHLVLLNIRPRSTQIAKKDGHLRSSLLSLTLLDHLFYFVRVVVSRDLVYPPLPVFHPLFFFLFRLTDQLECFVLTECTDSNVVLDAITAEVPAFTGEVSATGFFTVKRDAPRPWR